MYSTVSRPSKLKVHHLLFYSFDIKCSPTVILSQVRHNSRRENAKQMMMASTLMFSYNSAIFSCYTVIFSLASMVKVTTHFYLKICTLDHHKTALITIFFFIIQLLVCANSLKNLKISACFATISRIGDVTICQ